MSDQYDGPAMAQHIYRLREQIARDTAEIEKLRGEVAALKATLPETLKQGCSVCGIGADGKAYGYVCSRSDCPTRITCGGTT